MKLNPSPHQSYPVTTWALWQPTFGKCAGGRQGSWWTSFQLLRRFRLYTQRSYSNVAARSQGLANYRNIVPMNANEKMCSTTFERHCQNKRCDSRMEQAGIVERNEIDTISATDNKKSFNWVSGCLGGAVVPMLMIQAPLIVKGVPFSAASHRRISKPMNRKPPMLLHRSFRTHGQELVKLIVLAVSLSQRGKEWRGLLL